MSPKPARKSEDVEARPLPNWHSREDQRSRPHHTSARWVPSPCFTREGEVEIAKAHRARPDARDESSSPLAHRHPRDRRPRRRSPPRRPQHQGSRPLRRRGAHRGDSAGLRPRHRRPHRYSLSSNRRRSRPSRTSSPTLQGSGRCKKLREQRQLRWSSPVASTSSSTASSASSSTPTPRRNDLLDKVNKTVDAYAHPRAPDQDPRHQVRNL